MAKDPELQAHQQWLGYLQPVGLVVSPPALVAAGAIVRGSIAAEHASFLEHVHEVPVGGNEPEPVVKDLTALLTDPALFGWEPADLIPASDPKAATLEVVLPVFQETIKPSYAVPEKDDGWLLLVREIPLGTDFDNDKVADARHWQASPQAKFERLLRETGVPIGLLANGTHLRLVYFPQGESPGHVTFPVAAMTEVAGRPVLAALLMLLGADRLFTLPDRQRLPALLAESRKYQNTVSTKLADQVLAALFELLRGFQAADDLKKGDLLRDVLTRDPDQVYAGLVTVLMRLVFLLYAEDRGLMSDAEVYQRYYSLTGLWDRLRADESRNPDTMDQRYGGWAQLLAMFRLVHDGGSHTPLNRRGGTLEAFELPARHGYLFDPDRYPFLESRPHGHRRSPGERIAPPLVPDGVVYRVLRNLLVLDGERISYRTLDVEQIGSVYEAIMGYRLERAAGRSIALKPKKKHGAPVTVDLDALLAVKPADRKKWLAEHADQKVEGKTLNELKSADLVEGLVAALERKVARALTPNIVPPGGMVFQPSGERRRSGSHYTPRSLTAPIVRKALEPVLKQLGDDPPPDQVLGLKVCDPAMGSGAFLVETCRQVGDALLKAWVAHGSLPTVPDDETPELLAQRTVAQRCLYGVDKNPMAVDLAKLSLWLATLAKDHPFTFVDHSLKCGDSLVGLTLNQIRQFHWKPPANGQMLIGQEELRRRVGEALNYRYVILETGDHSPHALKEQKLKVADDSLNLVRFAGNLAVAAFFGGENDRKREGRRKDLYGVLGEYLRTGNVAVRPTKDESALRDGPHPIYPFHWEVEFPEVFGRETSGFDVIIGNPPFMGGMIISSAYGDAYRDWLYAAFSAAGNRMDLVAYFFRRAFDLLRPDGSFGLIATNTIAQGDTRSGGLSYICNHGGAIYNAVRRYKWPGMAAVVVSVIHCLKGTSAIRPRLDDCDVRAITAFLFHAGGSSDPHQLTANENKCWKGTVVLGMGFTFDDQDSSGVTTSLSVMTRLTKGNAQNTERIKPYIGGEELNNSPTHDHHRFIINFDDLPEDQARRWPDLFAIVKDKVKPIRDQQKRDVYRERWWQFAEKQRSLYQAIKGMPRVLANSEVSPYLSFAFLPTGWIYGHTLYVFALPTYSAFSSLQCRSHEVWARFFASSMKDDLRYTPSDCFETFPFPEGFETHAALETVGKAYYEFRADLMVRNNEGLTKTYNRFHDPNETSADILKLRELHAAMDRAVLDAYGGELAALTVPPCEFLLDYEDEDDEDDQPGKRQRKKPWRYRWPDTFRDEVLALLLDLNKQRAEQERLTAPAQKPTRNARSRKRAGKEGQDGNLF